MYDQISTLAKNFDDTENLLVAERCTVIGGFQCCGGLKDPCNEQSRRGLENVGEIFGTLDSAGLPMTPTLSVAQERSLAGGCPNPDRFNVPAYCGYNCDKAACDKICEDCEEKSIKQKKCRLKCRANGVEGLSFPVIEEPLDSLISILSNKPVTLMDFSPPEIIFGFEYELFHVLWVPPEVLLIVRFEFTVGFKFGVVLDTKGIEEAITQGKPEKALNSFALKDTFGGVDLPMVRLTGSVSVGVSASAGMYKLIHTE